MERPDCFDFAMELIGDPEESEIRAYIEQLERMVNVLACDGHSCIDCYACSPHLYQQCGGDTRKCRDIHIANAEEKTRATQET